MAGVLAYSSFQLVCGVTLESRNQPNPSPARQNYVTMVHMMPNLKRINDTT
jgi:hypothetical protein